MTGKQSKTKQYKFTYIFNCKNDNGQKNKVEERYSLNYAAK